MGGRSTRMSQPVHFPFRFPCMKSGGSCTRTMSKSSSLAVCSNVAQTAFEWRVFNWPTLKKGFMMMSFQSPQATDGTPWNVPPSSHTSCKRSEVAHRVDIGRCPNQFSQILLIPDCQAPLVHNTIARFEWVGPPIETKNPQQMMLPWRLKTAAWPLHGRVCLSTRQGATRATPSSHPERLAHRRGSDPPP